MGHVGWGGSSRSRISCRGAPTSWGAPTPKVAAFRKICMSKMKESGPVGGCVPAALPLDLPLGGVGHVGVGCVIQGWSGVISK